MGKRNSRFAQERSTQIRMSHGHKPVQGSVCLDMREHNDVPMLKVVARAVVTAGLRVGELHGAVEDGDAPQVVAVVCKRIARHLRQRSKGQNSKGSKPRCWWSSTVGPTTCGCVCVCVCMILFSHSHQGMSQGTSTCLQMQAGERPTQVGLETQTCCIWLETRSRSGLGYTGYINGWECR